MSGRAALLCIEFLFSSSSFCSVFKKQGYNREYDPTGNIHTAFVAVLEKGIKNTRHVRSNWWHLYPPSHMTPKIQPQADLSLPALSYVLVPAL